MRKIALDKKNTKIRSVVVLSLFFFIVLQVVYTILISSYGGKLSKLEEQYQKVQNENEQISKVIVEKSSLSSFFEIANNEGYVKPNTIIYLQQDDFVASVR